LIIVCIPAYNEEKTIAKVIIKARRYCDKIIVCDDGSTDYTGIIAKELGAEVIRHERNMGYGSALRSLFLKAATYSPDVVVTIDADMQHNPDDIPKLVKPIVDGKADIVIGARSKYDETPKFRRMGIKALSTLSRLGIRDVQSGFRAYKGRIIRDLMPISTGMDASIEILEKAVSMKLRILEIKTFIKYKGLKTSKLNLAIHIYDLITGFIHRRVMKRPITYLGFPGLVTLLIGILSGIWVIQRYIQVKQLATGTALIAVMLVISGLLLILTSILLYIITSLIRDKS